MTALDPELAAAIEGVEAAGVPEWHRLSVASARRVEDAANPYASVLRADHGDLPPATVVTAGHDPLRDEGRTYADVLDDAGTPVERLHYPSMAHGFLSLSDDVAVADDALDAVAARVRALG